MNLPHYVQIDTADEFAITYVCHNLRNLDAKEAFAVRFSDNPTHLAQDFAAQQITFAIRYHGRPCAIIGASEQWPGLWEVTLLTTEDFPRVVRYFIKFVREGIIPGLFDRGAHRAQVAVLSEYEQAKRLLSSIGAKPTTELRRFGRNKEDFTVFQWLEEDIGKRAKRRRKKRKKA